MSTHSTRARSRSSQGAAPPRGDIGAHERMAGVPAGDAPQLVRACGTSTADLDAGADWGVARGIQTAALAAPGGYGRPLCETLAARGRQGWLRRAQASTPGPDRKSEGRDWRWMQPVPRSGW
jgi:hypothetical protein